MDLERCHNVSFSSIFKQNEQRRSSDKSSAYVKIASTRLRTQNGMLAQTGHTGARVDLDRSHDGLSNGGLSLGKGANGEEL